MITFILLGQKIHRAPEIGDFMQVSASAPSTADLTAKRIAAARAVQTEFFSIVDGGPDLLLPEFEDAMVELCHSMNAIGADVGTARERVRGVPAKYMHHGIVCRTAAFKKLVLPDSGCIDFASMVYTMLSSRGVAICDREAYDWIPSPNGAARWHETPRAKVNGFRWAQGLPPFISAKYDGAC